MNFTKRNFLISGIIVLIPVLYQLIRHQSIQWTPLADTLFLISLPLLVIGLFGWVLSSGSFDFFHYSMRRVFRSKKQSFDEEEPHPHALSQAVGKSYRSILTIGFLVFLASILCLWEYFL